MQKNRTNKHVVSEPYQTIQAQNQKNMHVTGHSAHGTNVKTTHQSNFQSVVSFNQQVNEEVFNNEHYINKIQQQNKQENSLLKILSHAPTYRIAQPSKQTSNISSKFWTETNQTNRALAKQNTNQKSKTLVTNTIEGNKSQSIPRFQNEMLQNSGQGDELIKEEFQQIEENQEFMEYDEVLQQTAQDLNTKLSFQRALQQHNQPYSFLSQVGGKLTTFESTRTVKGYDLSQLQDQSQRIQMLTAQESLNIYKKIDIDKNIIPQIMIQNKINKLPQTVSTINKMNLTSLMNEQRIKENKSKERDIQTAADLKRQKDFNIKKQTKLPYSRGQTAQMTNKIVSASSRVKTGKQKGISKLSSKNSNVLIEQMDRADIDLGIVEDMADDNIDFYEKADKIKQFQIMERPPSNFTGKRPVSGLSVGTNQFFQNFQKFTSFNSHDIPYENLFDRNERTLCATFAKFGDLNYYAPVQRIGNYMQYGAKLKLEHLQKIISLQSTITNVERNEFEIPIQLSIIDDLNPFQQRNKTGISTTFNPNDLNREPVSLSLFPEYFEDKYNENLTAGEAADKYLYAMLNEMGGSYDPEYLGKSNYTYIDPSVWPIAIQNKVASSITRYTYYLTSDVINADEIPKLKREWIVNAINLIEPELLKNEELYKIVFQEIFENFRFSMKKAMLDYILRSPMERARLHIDLIPRQVLCSAERIAREGGFNIHLFNDWHQYVENGKEKSKQNLVLMNIINSALMNWFYDFQDFRLMEFDALKKISALGYTLSIQSFIKQQNIYKQNITSLMRYIWHRGAVLIIKKFKYLKRSNVQSGKWTFCGFKKTDWRSQKKNVKIGFDDYNDTQPEEAPKTLQFLRELHYHLQEQQKEVQIKNQQEHQQMQSLAAEQVYQSMLQFIVERQFDDDNHEQFDLFEDINADQLLDIRQNPAYMALAAKVHEDASVWKEENGWQLYTKEYKQKVLDNVGVMMGLQLRQMVETTMEQAEKFFLSFPTLKSSHGIYFDEDESDGGGQMPKDSENQSNISQKPSKPKINPKQQEMEADNERSQGLLKDSLKDQKELTFKKPEFLTLITNKYFPILNLEIIIQDDILKFKETTEFIKIEMKNYMRSLMQTFNYMQHPKNLKVNIDKAYNSTQQLQNSKNLPKQKHAWHNIQEGDENYMDIFDDFYRRFAPFIYITEKEDKKNDNIFAHHDNQDLKNQPVQNTQPSQPSEDVKINTDVSNRLLTGLGAVENNKKKYLNIGNYQEKCFQNIQNRIISHLLKHYEESAMTFQVFDQFHFFINKQVDRELKTIIAKKSNLTNDEFKNYYTALTKYLNLLAQIPDYVQMPLFNINCTTVKDELKNHITDLRRKLENTYTESLINSLRSIIEQYNKITSTIQKSTNTAEQVENMEKYIQALSIDKLKIKLQTSACFSKVSFLMKLNIDLGENITFLSKDAFDWPNKLEKELVLAEEKHNHERNRLEERLRDKRIHFNISSQVHSEEIEKFEGFSEYKLFNDYIAQVDEFEKILIKDQEMMDEIIDQEKKLYGMSSSFDNFSQLLKDFQPYSLLWKTVGQFVENKKRWLKGSITELDNSEIDLTIKEQTKICNRLLSQFPPTSMALRIVNKLREEVMEMNKQLPAIDLITRPGIKDRHWNEIFETIDLPITNIKDINLNRLLENDLLQHIVKIESIVDQASKEFTLEKALTRMQKEWENTQFVILNYKNSSIKILQGACIEDIQIVLDDHVIKAQTIRLNPNIKFMEQKAIEWEKLMIYIQQVLDIWISVQGMFLYLEPIFSYEDIFKTLASEAQKFQIVQDTWNMIMDYVETDKKVLHIDRIPNLQKELNHCSKLIEDIQKGLEMHLESKRLEFPRFFFLSNDDLITILAETRDPLLVQPHMKKCFEGINELIFNNSSDIIGMKSGEKEEINFLERIIVKNFKSNVEKWLLKVEEQMICSIAKVMEDSFMDIQQNSEKKHDWIRNWPGQIVLANNQLIWTEKVENKFIEKMPGGLIMLYKEMEQTMEKMANMVRGSLSATETLTIGALIVLEVHNRDVVKILQDDNINDIQSFEWLSQMRYYLISETSRIRVKMMTTTLDYGYEYLGNSPRLVITPLTDRCYRTLMSAIQLNLGGAPEGPAGTGKTETTKDLAKALAMQCLVFNCSDGLNIFSMAHFFKGLIASGAWSCFDEFNRIDVEVLSVIAQQISQIQDVFQFYLFIKSKANKISQIFFEGTELILKQSCNIFITMNPGYAGRSELPDNLKSLFRPVAMMLPDYSLIAEISLYSFGFVLARDLARKIVAVYKLASEQLSSQDHYDYGMRAVKAVLTTASQLKRRFPNEKEDMLVLRSITDVNLPKFLSNDIVLFTGITSDLFPQMKVSAPDYNVLSVSIQHVMTQKQYQNVPNLRKKIFQLYEVIKTRHGVMLVGQPYSGKTTCYQVLAQAMTHARREGDNNELYTSYYIINPKALTLQKLYGYSDNISKEWNEGILAEIYRKCANNKLQEKQFIVFDGPVDADWVENLNTVLDDNKKLCLMNGETIAMTNYMTMMFEVADLKQASPATVSRCGMVYLQPDQLGWQPLFTTWLQKIAPKIDDQMYQHIDELFDAYVNLVLDYVSSKCKEYQTVPDIAKVNSLMRLYYKQLEENQLFERAYVEKYKQDVIFMKLDILFIYCVIWTLAGSVDNKSRQNFNKVFKTMMREPQKCQSKKEKLIKFDKQVVIPEGGKILVYDYVVDKTDSKWKKCTDVLQTIEFSIPDNTHYNSIVVQTVEMLKVNEMIQNSIDLNYPLLMMGPTGTGKSTYINRYLKNLPMQSFNLIFVNFSAQTSCEKTQEIINNRLDRRRKGIYGPKIGTKCIIFVDDLNMPQYDKYGSQPPIELLRQLLDQEGWYGSDRQFMQIIDTQLISCMSPPGGGRNIISNRFLRHYSVVANIETNDSELERIFISIMNWHMKVNDFPKFFHARFQSCVKACICVFGMVIENLKPTPAKSHYQFNQRDLSRAVQGMTLMNDILLKDDNKEKVDMKIIKLWLNEMKSVFFDRLIYEQDQQQLYNDVIMVMRQQLKEDIKNIMDSNYDQYKLNLLKPETFKVIRFGQLAGEGQNKNKYYDEIISVEQLYSQLDIYLEEYNSLSKKPMKLIFFEFAVDHIIKISRILSLEQGHGLLIGLGGSGRQSLTMLSAFIKELPLFQIEVNANYGQENWIEDMQRVMIQAGTEHKELVFLISDNQITKHFILEDINSMLNSGDIPQIFSMEDFSPFIDKMRNHAKKQNLKYLYESGTNSQFYDYFVECVKQKVHIVMALSCVGTSLRNRIRMFPNIINCTNIVWYFQWPEEGLNTVATKNLSEIQIEGSLNRKITNIFKNMHTSSLELSQIYEKMENRIVYITPSSYLELQNNLKILFHSQKKKIQDKSSVYSNGVKQILATQEYVKKMEEELTNKKPILIQMNNETQIIADQIKSQVLAMEPKKQKVEIEEKEVNERVQEAEAIRQSCEEDLSIAKPKLLKATKALETLDTNDINNIKAMLKPPNTIKLVMEAICVLCKIPPVPIPNPKYPKERIMDYWEASRKFLTDKNFLFILKNYDKDNIEPAIMKKVRENYISQTKDFNPQRVEKASSAAKGMCEWILALDEYEKVLTIVRPKQEKYNESKQEVDRLQASLKLTRDELQLLNSQIETLENQFNELRQKQIYLEKDIQICEQKLIRASTLIKSLGGEQERWQQTALTLDNKLQYIVGDICLSAGIISYLGPFSVAYRNKIIKEWVNLAKKNTIIVSDNFSLEQTIGEPINIRKWVLNQLPSDSFSIENAIITYNTQRWPLMIDPQGQAHKWIILNEQYDGNKLIVTKQSDSNFLRNLENAIQFGQVLVIENTKEEIDSILDPVLSKQIFKMGGVLSIKIGDNIFDYSKNFKLYFTSKLRNPHFTPEISTRVTILNYTITKEGLQDQLLELCVSKEQPDDQELRSKLIVQRHENFKQLDDIERKILDVLHKAESILDDENAITILQNSKVLAKEIEEKQKYAEETENRINTSRLNYQPIAYHSSVLFFAVMDMGVSNILYQYSLDWFIKLYLESFDKSKKTPEIDDRVRNVNDYFTFSLYQNVCRSLFEKDKLVFSFFLLAKILESKHHLDLEEFKFFISPIVAESTDNQEEKQLNEDQVSTNPCSSWLDENQWLKIQALSKLTLKFQKIIESFQIMQEEWKELYFDPNIHNKKFPAPFQNATQMQRLCILKTFRPDKVIFAIQQFIKSELGEKFDNPPPFNINLSFADSSPSIPLIFILPGSDPVVVLNSFAAAKGKYLKQISLGQGQGIFAEKAIEDAKLNGSWVLLQNCHLCPSWMNRFEKINEDIQNQYALQVGKLSSQVQAKDKIHTGFRMWLTTYPSSAFPSSILQNSIKLTNEPPKGVKSNLLASYNNEQISDQNFFEGNPKSEQFKTLLYGLCFFHAIIQERRSFGPIGWNKYYEFNQSDLRISSKQLFILVGEYEQIPYKALHYIVAQCNYGGRVTDSNDTKILAALMNDCFSDKIFKEKYAFGECTAYSIPNPGSHADYLNFINGLPSEQPPFIFGFNENGQISKDMKETSELCSSLLSLWSSSPNLAEIVDLADALNVNDKICQELINRMPKKFDLSVAETKYPVDYNNSLNQVLHQELIRYNNLQQVITKSLRDIQLALQGDVVMSATLEEVGNYIVKGLVPELWLKNSYPSIKPLAGYIQDLIRRLNYFHQWIDTRPPSVHWISGFYFTQAFLTATLQNFARKYQIPIDTIMFNFQFFSEPNIGNVEDQGSMIDIKDGFLVYGLYFEGCRWDYIKNVLEESQPKILHTIAPIIWLKPIQIVKSEEYPHYKCPVYKTAERYGALTITGHSVNFIMHIDVPSNKEETHWIKRGVAMLCQLTD